MGTIYTQKTDNFQLIHNVTFADGDEVVFTHGNVDIHAHGRDNNADLGSAMSDVLSHSARQFGMVLLMPNLKGKDALMTPQMALNYHKRAVHASGGKLKILSTVYLNKGLTEDDFKRISEEEDIAGAKFYPDGGTTNSEQGLRTPLDAMEQLRLAQKYQVPILLHGQTRIDQDGHVMDEWDREHYFYNEIAPIIDREFPELPLTCEHVSTGVGMQFAAERKGKTLATATIPHLAHTRTDVFDTGSRTDMTMKPMIQHEREMQTMWDVIEGNPELVALGSDDAWHPVENKHAQNCACGGAYGPYRIGPYLDLFEKMGLLSDFCRFASLNAQNFYGVQSPEKVVRLRKGSYQVESLLPFGKYQTEPFNGGLDMNGWHLV